MIAAGIMTRSVVTVPPTASILDAMRLMLGQRISGLPVTDDFGRLVGMLTEGDLLRRAETGTERPRSGWMQFLLGPGRMAKDYVRTHGRKVEEIMTRDVLSISEMTPLDEVVDVMESRGVKRLAIVSDDKLIGIVSHADLLRALMQDLEKDTVAPSGDAALREAVLAELRKQNWSRPSHVSVLAADGIIYLEGFINDERERGAITVAAENTPGVQEVRDHLDYFDPNVGLMYGL